MVGQLESPLADISSLAQQHLSDISNVGSLTGAFQDFEKQALSFNVRPSLAPTTGRSLADDYVDMSAELSDTREELRLQYRRVKRSERRASKLEARLIEGEQEIAILKTTIQQMRLDAALDSAPMPDLPPEWFGLN